MYIILTQRERLYLYLITTPWVSISKRYRIYIVTQRPGPRALHEEHSLHTPEWWVLYNYITTIHSYIGLCFTLCHAYPFEEWRTTGSTVHQSHSAEATLHDMRLRTAELCCRVMEWCMILLIIIMSVASNDFRYLIPCSLVYACTMSSEHKMILPLYNYDTDMFF